MLNQLPPGPRMPAVLQMLGIWRRPTAFEERARSRYGRRFTVRRLGQPPQVILSDPEEIKEMFLAPPDVLHPGEGAQLLEPIVGPNSLILLDGEPHLAQRRVMLSAFHGEHMQRLAGLMASLAEQEVASWPREEPLVMHPHLQQLTLEVILRTVFGLGEGAQLDELRQLLREILAFAETPLWLLPPLPGALGRIGPAGSLKRKNARVEELVYALIGERRDAGGRQPHELETAGEEQAPATGAANGSGGRRRAAAGMDVLALLLDATHEDGSSMSDQELRDELMTALVAGHDTMASQLAWAFERLSREPRVLARLYDELDGGAGEEYLTATINEIMRHRPVLPIGEPRLVKRPVEIGGVRYPVGVMLLASAYLLHHDPAVYPEPYAFRPERFLEREGGCAPGTYTWIPFGGGRRRCPGASLVQLEMKLVLRAALSRCELLPTQAPPEHARRRIITVRPGRGGEVILRDRHPGQWSSPTAPAMVGTAT